MTFEVIRKNTAFSCNRAFCGAFRDGCMNTFDVTKNDFFRHLDIAIFFGNAAVHLIPLDCHLEVRFLHGEYFSSGYLTIMWVLDYHGVNGGGEAGRYCISFERLAARSSYR